MDNLSSLNNSSIECKNSLNENKIQEMLAVQMAIANVIDLGEVDWPTEECDIVQIKEELISKIPEDCDVFGKVVIGMTVLMSCIEVKLYTLDYILFSLSQAYFKLCFFPNEYSFLGK